MATSPNGTYVLGSAGKVTDTQGDVFAINGNGQITVNGVVDQTTDRVDALGYYDGQVWQKNADNYWYSKASAADTWANIAFSDGVPIPVPPESANNTVATAAFERITDGNGNQWFLVNRQVAVDGVVDTTTDRVIQLDYVNGVIWQENIDGNWYSKTTPSDTWTQATNVDPITGASGPTQLEAWTGAESNDAANANNWSQYHVPVAGEPLDMNSGTTMDLGGGNLAGDRLTFVGFGSGTINMTAGGSLKLDAGQSQVKVSITGGKATLDVIGGFDSGVEVTADRLSSGLLHAKMIFASLSVTGGTMLLNGDSLFQGTSVLFDSNLAGTGTALLTSAVSRTSHIEVTGSIGAGVTINAGADIGRPGAASVVLDSPKADHGKILLTDAYLELKIGGGIVIDSVSYKNDMLTLFSGHTKYAAIDVAGIKGHGTTFSGVPYTGDLNFARSAAVSVYAYNSLPGYLDAPSVTALPTHA